MIPDNIEDAREIRELRQQVEELQTKIERLQEQHQVDMAFQLAAGHVDMIAFDRTMTDKNRDIATRSISRDGKIETQFETAVEAFHFGWVFAINRKIVETEIEGGQL